MKRVLEEIPEVVCNQCVGCVFHKCIDPCYNLSCERFLDKQKDCKNKIFILREVKRTSRNCKRKPTVKKK